MDMLKKGISPLLATILLVAFALILGTLTMNFGRDYIEGISHIEKEEPTVIEIGDITDPLQALQIEYITGKISKEEYFEMEKELIK